MRRKTAAKTKSRDDSIMSAHPQKHIRSSTIRRPALSVEALNISPPAGERPTMEFSPAMVRRSPLECTKY
jgi:hypothetical protein